MKKSAAVLILVMLMSACACLFSHAEEAEEHTGRYDIYTYDITAGSTINVVSTGLGIYVRFVPVVGGEYWFESKGVNIDRDYDTSCSLYDADFNLLDDGSLFDDSGDAANFCHRFTLKAGQEYYYLCQLPDDPYVRNRSLDYNVTMTLKQPEAGHEHDFQPVTTLEATCTEPGKQILRCYCSMTNGEAVLPPLGHSGKTEQTEPTCTQSGEKTIYCSRCGQTVVETLPALGHEYESVYKTDIEPTCTAKGSESFHCVRCGLIQSGTKKDVEPLGHNFGNWSSLKPATCTATGIERRICSRCETAEKRDTPATGHSFSNVFTVDKAATCTATGSKSKHCKNCSEKTNITVIPANEHKFGGWVTTKEASCTAAGSRQRSCRNCSSVIKEIIAAKGHNFSSKFTVDKAATCTATGSKSKHCTRCSTKTSVTSIPATGHKFSAYKTKKAATCTANGQKTRSCSVCGKAETASIAKLGHKFSNSYTIDKKATPTQNGSKSFHCARCSSTNSKVSIPKISKFKLSKSTFVFNGNAKKPSVIVTDSSGKTVKNTNYTLAYDKNAASIGTHYITISFKGSSYGGSKKLSYKIIPQNVSGLTSSASGSKITLKWNAVKGAKGYKIYLYNSGTKTYEPLNSSGKTSCTVALAKGGAYKLAVKACTTVNKKDYLSGDFAVINCVTAPSAVKASGKSYTAGEINLNITQVNCSGYEIYVSERPDSAYRRAKTVNGNNANSIKLSSLKKDTLYFVKVRAFTKSGDLVQYSAFSPVIAVRTK